MFVMLSSRGLHHKENANDLVFIILCVSKNAGTKYSKATLFRKAASRFERAMWITGDAIAYTV